MNQRIAAEVLQISGDRVLLALEGARNEAHVVGKLGPGGAPLRLYTARGSVYLSRR